MKTLLATIAAGLAAVSVSVLSSGADPQYNYGHSNNSGYSNKYHHNNRYQQKKWHRSNNNGQTNTSYDKRWNWDGHNWNEQRAQLRANWKAANYNRLTPAQQQLLNDQMKAQWLRYHNNQWNGASGWDQYSDPKFLDYVHNNDPSLMTSLRTRFGF